MWHFLPDVIPGQAFFYFHTPEAAKGRELPLKSAAECFKIALMRTGAVEPAIVIVSHGDKIHVALITHACHELYHAFAAGATETAHFAAYVWLTFAPGAVLYTLQRFGIIHLYHVSIDSDAGGSPCQSAVIVLIRSEWRSLYGGLSQRQRVAWLATFQARRQNMRHWTRVSRSLLREHSHL